ncbi:hypothetical protein P692DRAFT_20746430, partial [Suillus brevipes Sb2]
PHPEVRAPAHTMTDDLVDVSTPSTTSIDITSPFCMPYSRPFVVLVDKCQITPTSTTTNYSILECAHLMDALLQATMTTIHSNPSVVINCDFIHLDGVFTGTNETSNTKIVEHHIDTLPLRKPPFAVDNLLVIDNSLSINNVLTIENALTIHHAPSHLLNLRSLALLDSFPTSLSTNTNPSGSTHTANVLADPTKTPPSWLKPLILVTKYRATGQLIPLPPTALPYQPEKLRPLKPKQQKRKYMAAQMNANRIVGHLAQVCENISVDKTHLMDAWVTSMAGVGLTSMLASNHQTSPGLTLPPTFDAPSILEPGSRTKARLASLRHRTNAVVATIPATTFPLSSPRPRTF